MDKTSPEVKKLFDDALPSNGGSHTLALGELHNYSEHSQYLADHPKLLLNHGVSSIGIESPAFFNVFLWAYQDGTLERETGSKLNAKNYLRSAFVAFARPSFREGSIARANLAIAAIDNNIDVVAYDSRLTFKSAQQTFAKNISSAHAHDFDEFGLAHSGNYAWLFEEFSRLSPPYKERTDAIESLIDLGHRRIREGKFDSDALSAIVFDTLAAPLGNRVTLGGIAHLDGFGLEWERDPAEWVKGTFGNHLFHVQTPENNKCRHMVTTAVIACTAMADEIMRDHKHKKLIRTNDVTAVMPIRLVDLERGTSTYLSHDDAVAPISRQEHIETPLKKSRFQLFSSRKKLESIIHAEILETHSTQPDPLLMPDIKAAAEAVRAAMNPEERGRPR